MLTLSQVAQVSIVDGPAMVKSENGRKVAWVFVDIQNTSIGEYIEKAKVLLSEELEMPPRYSVTWSGQYEYMQRVK